MSKKPLDTSQPPKEVPTLYLDESVPKSIAADLRYYQKFWRIEVHREQYPHDPSGDESIGDPEVIKKCGENDWVLVSADDKMRIVPENCDAAARYGARIVLFAKTYRTIEYLAALIAGRDKLLSFMNKNRGPFFARISRAGDMSVLPQDSANLMARVTMEAAIVIAERTASAED